MFNFLKVALPKADVKVPFRTYLSMIFLNSFLALALSIPATFFLIQLLKNLWFVFIPPVAFLLAFLITTFQPLHKARIRKRKIDANLPFLLTHMSSIAESGIPPHLIFKLIAEFKEYGEVAKEMEKITRNIEGFGLDVVTATREVAQRTPSESLREVLFGFVSTIEAGGDLTSFLREHGKTALFEWRIRRERFLRQLETIAEMYIGIVVAAPLLVVAIVVVMGLISPTLAGFHIVDLVRLAVYAGMPLINLVFLFFLRGVEVEI